MLRTPRLRALVAACACTVAHCALTPEFPAEVALVAPELRAVDARGQVVPLERLPRRPRLSIALPTAPNSGPWLLSGARDAALLDDLAKLPLSAAQLSRSVAVRQHWDGQRLEIEPMRELSAGGTYTFALPHKATMHLAQPYTAELHVDDSPLSGAAVRATFPAAEATSVPEDLAFALISFDGVVLGSAQGIWLEDPLGRALRSRVEDVACDDYDTAAVSCIRLAPEWPLEPASRYVLRSGRALTDAHGGVVSELQAPFDTRAQTAEAQNAWQSRLCALDEQVLPIGCALLSDSRLALTLFQNPGVRVIARLAGQQIALLPGSLTAAMRFSGLQPDRQYTLDFQAFDAGGQAAQDTWQLHTAAALPTIGISEVRADPRGSEPEQEFVELWNYGAQPQSLAALFLSDSPSELGTALPDDAVLAAGAHALLVSDNFEPLDTRDEAPAAGCPLLRIGKTLTRAGLANSGEALYLRTREAQRVSSAPGSPAPRAGQCLAPSAAQSDIWELGPCTPGR